MSQNKGGRRNRWHHHNKGINTGDKGKKDLEDADENNAVVQQFRAYGAELDEKHDRFERIIKIGRDICIESKRIIFLLHTIDSNSKKEAVLKTAKARLDSLSQTQFKAIAYEVENQDAYQYLRAYRSGLEEYIEAITFYQFLHTGSLQDCIELEKALTYTVSNNSNSLNAGDHGDRTIRTLVTPYEYILGIGDLTGELMRKCINNLATGDTASCYQTCNFVRDTYKGFLSCRSRSDKQIGRKLHTLWQSLHKMENVCYTIKVRGSEVLKHMLLDEDENDYVEYDEGYQAY